MYLSAIDDFNDCFQQHFMDKLAYYFMGNFTFISYMLLETLQNKTKKDFD